MDIRARCALAAASLALAGCGGGGPDGVAQRAPGQAAEANYVEQLDALCREGDEIAAGVSLEIDGLRRRRLPRAKLTGRIVELLDNSFIESNAIRARIRELEPPPSQERFHRRYNALSDRLVELNKSGRDAIARREGLGPFRRKAKRVMKQRRALVADHGGLRDCG